MFLSILSIFTGPFRSLATWAMVITVALGMGFGYLKFKEHEAAQEALIRFNHDQLVLSQKQNAQNQAELDSLKAQALELNNKIATLDQDIEAKEKVIDSFIVTSKDTNFDPLFNQVLQQMRKK